MTAVHMDGKFQEKNARPMLHPFCNLGNEVGEERQRTALRIYKSIVIREKRKLLLLSFIKREKTWRETTAKRLINFHFYAIIT